ncbi:MAG TPA: hypothetical protein VE547_07255 [Mycobacteriales bacterium]|nr:hypothetical protein [Mycobacteriales bacterium]
MTADDLAPARRGGEDPVAVLTRWEAAGAVWRVVARRGDAVTVALHQCDGGAEVGRLTSTDPGLTRYLAGRDSNLD